jgi:hypothetical protein
MLAAPLMPDFPIIHSPSSSSTTSAATVLDSDLQNPLSNTIDPVHTLSWTIATERGYKYTGESKTFEPLHPDFEDFYWPSSHSESSYISKSGDKVFLIADGHGGAQATHYIVPKLASAVIELLDSQSWDFTNQNHQTALSSHISNLFKSLDNEYNSLKIAEYMKWQEFMDNKHTTPVKKPVDDGCTLILNILCIYLFILVISKRIFNQL